MNDYQLDSEQTMIPEIACNTTSHRQALIALAEVIRDVYIAMMNDAEVSQSTERVQ